MTASREALDAAIGGLGISAIVGLPLTAAHAEGLLGAAIAAVLALSTATVLGVVGYAAAHRHGRRSP